MKSIPIHIVLYATVVALFLAIIGDTLLTTGLFMDGLIYADVANNMAHGIGSFWHPSYTLTQFPEFYEHPPLAMGLLSVFFRVFGDGIWVVRLYSMLMTVLTALLMLQIWHQLGYELKMGWLPLLFWTLIPAVTLNSHENMLECTMAVFVLASALEILRGKWWRMLIAGLLLYCAFLTKGFTGLYPLALPWILCLTRRRDHAFTRSFAHAAYKATRDTLLILIALFGAFWLTCWFSSDAWHFFNTYFNNQVVEGINDDQVSNHFYIVKKFLEETVILWVLVIAGIVIEIKRCKGNPYAEPKLPQLPMSLLVLCGVLPIMISGKQRSFYILTVYPFLAVAVAASVNNLCERMCEKASKGVRIGLCCLSAGLIVFAIIHNVSYCGKPGRDIAMQEDLKVIAPMLEDDELVSVSPEDFGNYSLQGYYWQAKRISITPVVGQTHLLTADSNYVANAGLDSLYAEVPIETKEYRLYRRIIE